MKEYTKFNSKIVRCLKYFLIALIFTGCNKNNEQDQINTYLVDFQLVSSIPVTTTISTMTFLGLIYPEISPLISSAKYDVDVYKVTYKTHFKTEEIVASGLICIPNSNEEFPLVSFQNGTNTLNSNAPSNNPNSNSFKLLESFAGNGYIIVIPDYIGFGASSQFLHPYYVKEPTNNAIMDLMHAAGEFIKTAPVSAKLNGNTYLMGYSQGGWATLSVFNQIETGNEDFEITATSCGAGAYNLLNVSCYIARQLTFPGPLYMPYYIYSHQVYGTLTDSLDIFFNEPYSSRIPFLFDGLHNSGAINSELNDTVNKLLKTELIASLDSSDINNNLYSSLKDDLLANSISSWQLNGLLRFYHGNIDDNVPVSESQNIYHNFIKMDVSGKVEYFEMEGLDHETGVIPWGIQTMIWFNSLENSN